jgi:hypothetical protein
MYFKKEDLWQSTFGIQKNKSWSLYCLSKLFLRKRNQWRDRDRGEIGKKIRDPSTVTAVVLKHGFAGCGGKRNIKLKRRVRYERRKGLLWDDSSLPHSSRQD